MAKRPEKPLPEKSYLWSILDYDETTGALIWKTRPLASFGTNKTGLAWNAKHGGRPAFVALGANRYLYGSIWGVKFLAHRIIFKMMVGRDPVGVDHIDGNTQNNRWRNLREASQSTNCRNSAMPRSNTSGHVGVYFIGSRNKWVAAVKIGGKFKNLGYFDDYEDAVAARRSANRQFGFHDNHGRPAHGKT